jgi:hypothetical protein
LVLIFLIILMGIRPPAPKPATAPVTEFSAERARDVLRRLVGDGIPHPSGSLENSVVRQRVIDELKAVGYEPEIQSGFACDEYGDCGTAQNVVARLDGTEPGTAVLLAAHYDSAAAGPGASDDGMGAASVLEIARALKLRTPPRHPVIILIDDGEEVGLLGARVFTASHPWAKDVRAAVNLDNRGTSGPAYMFETGSANAWAVKLYAASVSRSLTSSIFYTAYKELPNDTDFTVFKAAGYQGVNFAIIGDEPHYHTQLDNFANASPASLQDEGAAGLAMASAFANADIASPPQSEAVYFDVLNRWTISWPQPLCIRIAIAAGFLLLLEIGWLFYKRWITPRTLTWGLFYLPLAVALTLAVSYLIYRLLHFTGAQPIDFIAHPLPSLVAFWTIPLAVVVALALAFAKRAGHWALWSGVWFWWVILAIVTAARVPAVSYLFLLPAAVAVVAALPACLLRDDARAAFVGFLLPLLTAELIGFGLLIALYSALGVVSFVMIAVCLAILISAIAPIIARFRLSGVFANFPLPTAAFIVAAAATFGAFIISPYSAKAPEHLNIEYFQDADAGKSQWVLSPASGKLPEPLRVTTNFAHDPRPFFPWDPTLPFHADAPHLDFAPPSFTILESTESQGRRQFRALLRSERGAIDAAALFPPDSGIENVSVENQPIGSEAAIRQYTNGWFHIECATMPAKGVDIAFSLPIGKPVTVTALDQTYGLPQEGSFLVKARPFTATAFGDGDRTLVTRHVQLLP